MNKILLAVILAGCALTSKAKPVEVRYFTPEHASPAQSSTPATHAPLRLGRIGAASHLRGAIVHRDSRVELAPYETLRWSEAPDLYVRRAVSHELFETRGLVQAVSGDVPALDIDVLAFEEVRRGTACAGRVELQYVIRDDHRVLARGNVSVERTAANPTIEAVVAAIGDALQASSAELGTRVVSVVEKP